MEPCFNWWSNRNCQAQGMQKQFSRLNMACKAWHDDPITRGFWDNIAVSRFVLDSLPPVKSTVFFSWTCMNPFGASAVLFSTIFWGFTCLDKCLSAPILRTSLGVGGVNGGLTLLEKWWHSKFFPKLLIRGNQGCEHHPTRTGIPIRTRIQDDSSICSPWQFFSAIGPLVFLGARLFHLLFALFHGPIIPGTFFNAAKEVRKANPQS